MTKIETRVILELMGRPPEHLAESINTLVIKIGSEKGVKVIDKKIHPPIPIKEAQNLYSSFAELEVDVDSINTLLMVVYTYSPSNLEIMSPEKLKISNDDLNAFLNSLLGRVHNHGAILKRTAMERDILVNQMAYLKEKLGDSVEKALAESIPKQLSKKEEKPKPKKKANSKKKTKKNTEKSKKKSKG